MRIFHPRHVENQDRLSTGYKKATKEPSSMLPDLCEDNSDEESSSFYDEYDSN